MKKILGTFTGLVFIYIGIYLFLSVTSNNMAYKENTYINKAIASIKVFEDSGGNTEYGVLKTNLYNEKWTSNQFPNGSYSKVSVFYGVEGSPVPQAITTSVSFISRSSH